PGNRFTPHTSPNSISLLAARGSNVARASLRSAQGRLWLRGWGSATPAPHSGGYLHVKQTKPLSAQLIELPAPESSGDMSLEKALALRRSVREFRRNLLTDRELSQ